jgi:hypothetical protein
MNFYDALVAQAAPVAVEPSETSYFSTPGVGLDPRLIQNNRFIPAVRSAIMRILFEHLKQHYYNPEAYVQVWIAGSAISYQWSSARTPADLDCLIGVNYLMFRQANPQYKGLSDQEIASMFNEDFRDSLHPMTNNFLNAFELTFYVNVKSDIKLIKPYAAYSLTNDDWTVSPEVKKAPVNKAWDQRVVKDTSMTTDILARYTKALTDIGGATTDTARRNAEAALKLAVDQGAALFEDIHQGRKSAFSPSGQGYSDIANYRWQAGKAAGTVQALKKLKDIASKSRKEFEAQTYGFELPDTRTLVRRALTSQVKR